MGSKYIYSLILMSSIASVEAVGYINRPSQKHISCSEGPSPIRISARHIEGNGVGYNQGYTTLEGFISPSTPWGSSWLPFIDMRAHIFNDGRPAANVGLGTRYLGNSQIWGINTYYDYRKTRRQHYNQVSVGFEVLGKVWDVRLNGYLPLGDKTSPLYDLRFDRFQGHYALLSRKQEFALKGANAEAGFHIDTLKPAKFYFAAGPYYLNGQGKSAWGGKARAVVDLYQYVQLEGSTSYDHLFGWVGQGQLSLTLPLGNRKQIKQKKSSSCKRELSLAQRARQSVDRNEIIPIDRKRKRSIAINPATGLPYSFYFVDNTSASLGTFESPFPSLMQAQNASSPFDVIYVLPGDGTTQGMNQGFVMQDQQKLWGSATEQQLSTSLGTIPVPPLTSAAPLLSNTNLNTPAVTLANSCEVSGVHITATNGGSGILGGDPTLASDGITNALIHNNELFNLTIETGQRGAITLGNCQGDLIIENNQFSAIAVGSGFDMVGEGSAIAVLNENSVNASLRIASNTITNSPTGQGIVIDYNPLEGQLTTLIQRNRISNLGGNGISLWDANKAIDPNKKPNICAGIFNNVILGVGGDAIGGFSYHTNPEAHLRAQISSNQTINGGAGGIILDADQGNICAAFDNNISQNNTQTDYQLDVGSGSMQIENLETFETRNVGDLTTNGTVTSVPSRGCSCKLF